MRLRANVFRPSLSVALMLLTVTAQMLVPVVGGPFASRSIVYATPNTEASTGTDTDRTIQDSLQEVLAQSEFQPRGNTQNAWERFKQKVAQRVTETIAEIWRGIPRDLIKLDPGSGLGYWLLRLAELAAAIVEFFTPLLLMWRKLLVCAGVLAILYVVYVLVRAQLRRPKPRVLAERVMEVRSIRTFAEVQALGATRAGLLAFRELLRDQLERKYSIAISATDREMCRTLPKDEFQTELFTRTADLFESVEFAGFAFSGERLAPLFDQYQQAPGRLAS